MTEESLFGRSRKKWRELRQRGRDARRSPLPATNQLFTPPSSARPSPSLDSPSASASPPPLIEGSTPITAVSTREIAAEQQDPPVNLWQKAFEKSSDGTKKWIREHDLDLSEKAKPDDHIREITRLIESNTLCTDKDGNSKIDIGFQKIVFREYIAGVVAFLTMAGDIAINFAPPQASAPWAIAKGVLQIPVKQSDQMAALAGTVQCFIRIVRRGQLYELLYNTKTTDENAVLNLHDALLDLYVAAIELLARSDNLIGSGVAKQTLNAILRPEQATGLVADLFQKEQKLLQEIPICEASRNERAGRQADEKSRDLLFKLEKLSSPLIRIDEGVTGIRQMIDEDRLQKLLEFISSEGHGKSHGEIEDSRIDNTGDWLIDHEGFRAWQAIPSSSTLLWLKGTVGTGKTYLTWRAIDYVKKTLAEMSCDEGFAFFYCRRSATSLQDPLTILRSFVRQLFDKKSEHGYDRLIQKCDMAKKEGHSLGLKDCKELILEFINLYSKTTIILDALDEASSTSTNHNLAEILIDMMDKAKKPVKIFISSRPDREYLQSFESTATITVDSSNQQGDIEKYLQERLYSTSSFKQRQAETRELIRNAFSSRNSSMFRWVHLQVQRLKNYTSHDAVKSWASTLPSTLAEAYDQLFDDMRKHNEYDVALAERAIKWVRCSMLPLRSEVLLEAIRYSLDGSSVVQKEKQTEQQILTLCRDLLTIDPDEQVWVLPHASVAEYFEQKGIARSECDLFVSRISLQLLMDFKESPKISTGDRFDPIPTFDKYIVYNWFKHVGQYDEWLGLAICANPDPELVIVLKRFLGSPEKSSDCYKEWVGNLRNVSGKGFAFWERKELLPDTMALFAMCRYGFYHTLRDWWEGNEISKEMALKQCEAGYTSLVHAAKSGCVPIAERLIGLAGTDYPPSERYKAMREAIALEKKDIAALLVAKGRIDINADETSVYTTAHITTIVQEAAKYSPKMLRWLIDQGWVDVNRETGTVYGTPLIAAASSRNLQSVEILLKAGANANAAVGCGKYFLYGSALAAVVQGRSLYGKQERTYNIFQIIQLLLENGADPNQPLKSGAYGSALESFAEHEECSTEDIDAISLLLKSGADPTMVFDRGDHGSALAAVAFFGHKELLVPMIGATTKSQAMQCLRLSRHPGEYIDYSEHGANRLVERRAETAKYLADEIGVDEKTLHKIGLWDVTPEVDQYGDYVFTFK
ncbi:hypothetical protein FP744_10001343 [Trichoderma asperellum]|nr:hypothetical protein LI328DRAFT_171751 [Trichoderma asperelloides]